jgi:hypothetical protein
MIKKTVGDYPCDLNRHLGGNCYVTVTRCYRRMDIRKFWLPEGEDKIKATRTGISLTFEALGHLQNCTDTIGIHIPELDPLHCSDVITNGIANCGFTLGGGMYMDTPDEPLHCTRLVNICYCPVCSEGFTRRDSLKRHQRSTRCSERIPTTLQTYR